MYFKNIFLIFVSVVIVSVIAQYDGEFWWLNKKLSDYRDIPSAPKYEQLTKFDTDESDKIVFRDDTLADSVEGDNLRNEFRTGNEISNSDRTVFKMHFQDISTIVWPDARKEDLTKNDSLKKSDATTNHNKIEDVFEFKLPEDEYIVTKNKVNKTNKAKNRTDSKKPVPVNVMSNNAIKYEQLENESENICTTMRKVDCDGVGGVVYVKYTSDSQRPIFKTQLVCCILPFHNEENSKIHFRDSSTEVKRIKRSEKGGTDQRLALLLRKYVTNKVKLAAAKKKQDHRIITPDDEDYTDPYENIKTSNLKEPVKQSNQKIVNKYDCNDYVEDEYADEMPQPGLVGLYSDHGGGSSWSYGGGNDNVGSGSPYGGFVEDEEDGGTSFSYGATIDPRLDRLPVKPPIIGRPVKLATTSNEHTYDADSQTISYQSNPDFQVLQGYKLLNLVRNRRKFNRGKKITIESLIDDSDSRESVLRTASFESDYDLFDKNMQVYENCGRVSTGSDENGQGKQNDDAVKGSHPWLALVIQTRRQQKIQCYATIVHPKAAVTSADCLHGRSPGDVSLIAGAWDLNAETREKWQKRMASSQEHPKYRPGGLTNNLAVLHWKRPLHLNANVQPACLSDYHTAGGECKFFGWGGYDQAIRRRPRWQIASILSAKQCNERLLSNRQSLPNDAFCASVSSRGTVTGVGGPLVCHIGSRQAAVGVAVWRDELVVLISPHDWVRDTLEALGIL